MKKEPGAGPRREIMKGGAMKIDSPFFSRNAICDQVESTTMNATNRTLINGRTTQSEREKRPFLPNFRIGARSIRAVISAGALSSHRAKSHLSPEHPIRDHRPISARSVEAFAIEESVRSAPQSPERLSEPRRFRTGDMPVCPKQQCSAAGVPEIPSVARLP